MEKGDGEGEGRWRREMERVRGGGVRGCCLLDAERPSYTVENLREGSAQTIVLAASLRQKLPFKICLIHSTYTDTGPTGPSSDPVTPGAWQGSQWSANVYVTGMTMKNLVRKREWNPGAAALGAGALTTRPRRLCVV